MLHPLVTSQSDGNRRVRPLLRTTLGQVLRRTRLDQGRTLADVARAAKVSMQYLSEVERGRKEASSEVLAAICDALETDLPEVLAEVGRELAAPLGQHATIVRLGTDQHSTGPDQLAVSRRPVPPGGSDLICLLAA
jgi:transcriptional regulator with XRE-family HTH domain